MLLLLVMKKKSCLNGPDNKARLYHRASQEISRLLHVMQKMSSIKKARSFDMDSRLLINIVESEFPQKKTWLLWEALNGDLVTDTHPFCLYLFQINKLFLYCST